MKSEHKIQSGKGSLVLEMDQVPKILKPMVDEWTPEGFIVSFKVGLFLVSYSVYDSLTLYLIPYLVPLPPSLHLVRDRSISSHIKGPYCTGTIRAPSSHRERTTQAEVWSSIRLKEIRNRNKGYHYHLRSLLCPSPRILPFLFPSIKHIQRMLVTNRRESSYFRCICYRGERDRRRHHWRARSTAYNLVWK